MDYSKLKAKVTLNNTNIETLVDQMKDCGISVSRNTLYRRFRGESEFTREEILALKSILNLTQAEVLEIFFSE